MQWRRKQIEIGEWGGLDLSEICTSPKKRNRIMVMVLSNFAKKRGGKAQLALPVPTPMTCALKLSTFKRDDIVNGRLE